MNVTPAIEAAGLTKRFGDFTAVADLDLRVETGTVVSLLVRTDGERTVITAIKTPKTNDK